MGVGSREFAARELAPRAADIDHNNSFPKDVNLWTLMGEFGLHGDEPAYLYRSKLANPGLMCIGNAVNTLRIFYGFPSPFMLEL